MTREDVIDILDRISKETSVISNRKIALAVGLSWMMATLSWASEDAKHPFNPVGEWRAYHTDGKPFQMVLRADKSAETDFGKGEKGIWRWEGEAVRVMFTDGWDDVIELHEGALRKRSWEPGADRCGPSTNSGPVESVSK